MPPDLSTAAPPRPPPSAALPAGVSLDELRASLLLRARARLSALPDAEVADLLSEAVFLERRRFADARGRLSLEDEDERRAVERAARGVHLSRREQEAALLAMVDDYVGQIHNRFSPRTYRFATTVLPGGLSRLLQAGELRGLVGGAHDPLQRIRIEGDLPRLQRLVRSHTLMLTPTHLSNLDSPLIGYALYAAGLPPFIYGAGLNLFSNPLMAFFMSRLGAYTVDRRKRHQLYKDTLKDYSTESVLRGRHSLFFPGGTRARSGEVEQGVKKGLLGTGLIAWQEALRIERAGGPKARDVLVVPCTLTYAMVLEAETLIEDALKESGQRRYIISDDAFSEPRTIATFAQQILALDASVIVRFGDPVDLFGNPVDDAGGSLGHGGEPIDPRAYVCDAEGVVQEDPQRDRVYTAALSRALVHAWSRDNTAMETHLAAFAAYRLLCLRTPRRSTWERMFLSEEERTLPRSALLAAIGALRDRLDALVLAGQLRAALPEGPERDAETLSLALDRFGRFHREACLSAVGADGVRVAPKLALYYSNRLAHYGLQDVALDVPAAPRPLVESA